MITSVNRSHAATVEAAASTQREHTNATVVPVINTWCCMEDWSAQVQRASRVMDVVKSVFSSPASDLSVLQMWTNALNKTSAVWGVTVWTCLVLINVNVTAASGPSLTGIQHVKVSKYYFLTFNTFLLLITTCNYNVLPPVTCLCTHLFQILMSVWVQMLVPTSSVRTHLAPMSVCLAYLVMRPALAPAMVGTSILIE